MAIKLSTHKCIDCQGRLEFNKEEKRFECPYCGKIYEKNYQFDKVQIDGLAGINDIVRTTLINISKLDFENAQDNLSECEKINYNFVGTTIAYIAYYLFRGSYDKGFDKNVANGKIKYYLDILKKDNSSILDEEKQLYDYLDNPEVYAALYIVYLSTSLNERAEYIANFIDFDKILNPSLNKSLLAILLKVKSYNEADAIINNIHFIDKRYTLFEVLKYYPSNETKLKHVQNLFENEAFTYKDEALIKKYLEDTNDSLDIRLVVLTFAAKMNIDIEFDDVLEELFSNSQFTSPEAVEEIFAILSKMKLSNKSTNLILQYCFSDKCYEERIVIAGLKALREGGSLFEFPPNAIEKFIQDGPLDNSSKIHILDYIFSEFKITSRTLDNLIRFVLIDYEADKEHRFELISYLLDKVKSLTLDTLQDYLVKTSRDEEKKSEIITKILSLNMNKAYFNNLLSPFILLSSDERDTKLNILTQILDKFKLTIDSKSLNHLVTNYVITDEMMDLIFYNDVSIDDDLVNLYFESIIKKKINYNSSLMAKLITSYQKINRKTLEYFLFNIAEIEVRKGEFALTLIRKCTEKLDYECSFNFLGETIHGNLTQKYLLTSKDAKSDKFKVTSELTKNAKLSEKMNVDNKNLPFKKYILAKKEQIDEELDSLCNELGVYKLFF